MKFIKCLDSYEIGEKVGQIFINQVKAKPNSLFILATGSSPITTYQYICNDYKINHTDWSKAKTFNLDEYLDLNHAFRDQSYRFFMNINLFNRININKNHTYFPNKDLVGNKYQELINHFGQIDLCILGVGNNGHIAFNEPGTSIDTTTHVVNLTESSRLANSRFFANQIDNVPKQAITMGLKEILLSKQIILIATGKSKREAIEHLKNAKQFDCNWPITILINHPNVLIYVDDLSK